MFYYIREGMDMSNMGTDYFVNDRYMSVEPEWVRSERYEYCEGFGEVLGGRSIEKVQKKQMSMSSLSKKVFSCFF